MVIDCQGREAMRKISSANEEEWWYLRGMENELEGLKEATFHDLEEQAKKDNVWWIFMKKKILCFVLVHWKTELCSNGHFYFILLKK